jgi:hypothetical protein
LSQPLPHLVGHHLRLSNVLERISQPSCEPLYATNIPTVNNKRFFINILCLRSVCPQKQRTTGRCSSVVHSSSTVAMNTGRWKKSENPVIRSIIHHHQNLLESAY